MLQVGDRPIVHHLMDIYARHGVTEFVLAAGYKRDVIETYLSRFPQDWSVEVVDTGEDAGTGDRVVACLDRMGETFFATYGDGLGDVDIDALARAHRDHGGATVTVVPLRSQYGVLVTGADNRVTEFQEKPVLGDHLINAGFFVFDRAELSTCGAGSLERDMLPELGRRGSLYAYQHRGFWSSMDTSKDVIELDQLARRKDPPWLPTRP